LEDSPTLTRKNLKQGYLSIDSSMQLHLENGFPWNPEHGRVRKAEMPSSGTEPTASHGKATQLNPI